MSLSFSFSHQNPVCTSVLPHVCHIPCPSHFLWIDHPDNIWWDVQIMKVFIWNTLKPPLTSSFLCPSVFLSTLFSNTLSLLTRFYPNMRWEFFQIHLKDEESPDTHKGTNIPCRHFLDNWRLWRGRRVSLLGEYDIWRNKFPHINDDARSKPLQMIYGVATSCNAGKNIYKWGGRYHFCLLLCVTCC